MSLPALGDDADALPFTSAGSLPFALAADKAENPVLSSLLYCAPPPPAPPAPPALRPAEPLEKIPLEKKLFFLPFAAPFAPAPPASARGVWMSVLINASRAVGSEDDASLPPSAPDGASPVVASAVRVGATLPLEVAVVEVEAAADSPPPEVLSWEEVPLRTEEDAAAEGDAVPASTGWPHAAP